MLPIDHQTSVVAWDWNGLNSHFC